MYRYCVDNAVTYSPEDIVLFRESPFACWMERLTLENPDHGTAPDADSTPPVDRAQRQDALAQMLISENKHVELIDWEAGEPERRTATLGAMRRGVDFILNGQLAVGPLSGPANLLMRTSGYSELGNYLYVPADTQAKTTLYSAFRLCFLADLLHSLQGQLPPQMLVIRRGSDLLPLRTEDHIYHYNAVKQRFMRAMAEFRKHKMPDPAESVHFGRWSECANEVLRKRALRNPEELEAEESALDQSEYEEAPQDLAALNALAASRSSARVFTPERGPDPSAGLQRLDFVGSRHSGAQPGSSMDRTPPGRPEPPPRSPALSTGPLPGASRPPPPSLGQPHPLDTRDYRAAEPPHRHTAELPEPRLHTGHDQGEVGSGLETGGGIAAGSGVAAEEEPPVAPHLAAPVSRPFSSSLITGPEGAEDED